jgi:hypothetical protein
MFHPLSKQKSFKMSDPQWSWKRLAGLLLIVAVAGCYKTPATTGVDSETGSVDPADAAASGTKTKKIIPINRDVRSLDGNWVMVVTGPDKEGMLHDRYVWILRLSKDADGKYQAAMVDTTYDKNDPAIESVGVDGQTVSLKVRNKIATIDFLGDFDGRAIRGTLAGAPQEMYLARMLSTDEEKLEGFVESALPPAADVFMNAIKSMQKQPQPKVILDLAREHRTSPISLEAVFGLLNLQIRAEYNDETIREIVGLYVELSRIWGSRMRLQAEMIIAQQLIGMVRLPDDALNHLAEAEPLLGLLEPQLGGRVPAMKARIQILRDQAQLQSSLVRIRSKSDDERTAAFAALQSELKKQPYNPEILLALAEYCAATKQRLAAIEHYSVIVAMPMIEALLLSRRAGLPPGDPTPREVLAKLWTAEYGNPDDLQSHLIKLHHERLASLQNEIQQNGAPVVPAEAGDHTVLVEFFTGGQAASAVATEIGIDALRQTYPAAKVVALRYHQHIPGPDGLVNQDSEDRFAYYALDQTPMLAVDGAVVNPDQVRMLGFVNGGGSAYSILRAIVDPRLKQSTPIRIELAGRVDNGELTIEAAVTGATEDELPSLRLRLALVEETVESPMPNGIRRHAMVVREMPGGARGIAAKKGELKFSFSMPAEELQQHLTDYMSRYEAGSRIEIPAEVKPPVRGPLHLVGWVQNDKLDTDHPEIGRAVLQTAIVPVSGHFPDGGSPATPDRKPESTAPARPASTTPPAPALPE